MLLRGRNLLAAAVSCLLLLPSVTAGNARWSGQGAGANSNVGCGQGPRVNTCVVPAHGNGTDDTAGILDAFARCGHGGRIVFTNTTYHIGQVMKTTDLSNVQIDIYGTLLWSSNITYWLNNSMPIGYQNQSTVWFLGGERITVNGYGYGTFDGNGQAWYDVVKGVSNYPDRPMGLTIWHTKDSVFTGIRFVQSQMWTMTVMYSSNVLLEDIYVHSYTTDGNPARNTDGCDTLFSDRLTFRRWLVDNGDDAISLKANTTNVVIEDSTFMTGQGFAIGSIGQYPGAFEIVENVLVRNLTLQKTKYAAYIKTWTGEEVGYPPNGGGGGFGYINNLVWQDFTLIGVRAQAISVTQCTTFSGTAGNCDSSLFKIENVTAENFTGTIASSQIANIQCSEDSGGCGTLAFSGMNLEYTGNNTAATAYICSNVDSYVGFNCTNCAGSSCGAHGS